MTYHPLPLRPSIQVDVLGIVGARIPVVPLFPRLKTRQFHSSVVEMSLTHHHFPHWSRP